MSLGEKIIINLGRHGIVGIENVFNEYGPMICDITCVIKYMELLDNYEIIIDTCKRTTFLIRFDNKDNRDRWYKKYFRPEYDRNILEKKIDNLINKNQELEKKLDNVINKYEELEEMIRYMPNGPGYEEAKEDFEELIAPMP